jgi:uncharacterized membrane protein
MKKTFLTVFILAILFNILSYVILPDRVAIHFSLGGRADGWASKEINLLFFLGLYLLMFLLFWYSPSLLMNTPKKWINLPNKSFWLAEENKPAAIQKIESLMWKLGSAFFIFFFIISALTLDANLSNPVKFNESLFFIFLAIFLIYTVYWCIKLFQSFRLPQNREYK